jgi:nuclear transport factor 2 (NTF2) superfamily protein
VLWWAWSGEEPFGLMSNEAVHGFAVCQYDSGQIYRFSCNSRWEVVNDMDHANEDSAKADIPLNYDESRVEWRRYARPM